MAEEPPENRENLPEISSLPQTTVSQLRSALVIPTLPAILVELIQNSLDAQSSAIHVVLDLDRWTIKCEDDGQGMTSDELSQIGTRYSTSKLDQRGRMQEVETFGFRGEALASIADAALLEILTRRDQAGLDGETYTLVLRGEERLVVEQVAKVKRQAHGTTVWARDIFYKVLYPTFCSAPARRG